MLSVSLARQLQAAGLVWTPARGDRFVVAMPDLEDDVFVLSDMTVEAHDYPTGRVLGFNGSTEWAMDSVEQRQTLWLPHEDQLRELLGAAFLRLERAGAAGLRVVVDRDGAEVPFEAGDAADAYGLALLHRLEAGLLADLDQLG